VWALDPVSLKWHLVGSYEASLGDRHGQAPAYDPVADRVLVLNSAGETWAFDYAGNEWENREPLRAPTGRAGHRMVYDRQSERMILFGGFRGQAIDDPPLSDTWAYEFETNEWEEMRPDLSPPARMYHAMAYDSESDRVILWGGRKLEPLEDNSVWAYDFESDEWTPTETLGGPPVPLGYPIMVYLEASDRMFVFGGIDLEDPFEGDLHNGSWILDFDANLWTFLTPASPPPPVAIHSATYDPESGVVFVFGGEREDPYSNVTNNELWTYDPTSATWLLR
jgi:hypothetical protein